MGYLSSGSTIILDAKLTNKGREKIANGNFNITYFQIGDSEFDYSKVQEQNVLIPFDNDLTIKHPYCLSTLTTGTTFGTPVRMSTIDTVSNLVTGKTWVLDTTWVNKPIGLDNNYPTYAGNKLISTKNLLGYTTISGQSSNNTTITNSFGENVIVLPEEQHSLGIIHYETDSFLNDGYIDDISTFKLVIEDIYYDRITNTVTGATFIISGTPKYINSTSIDSYVNSIIYYDLVDTNGYKVGKVFVNNGIIVIDDQELVAVLDSGSKRNYTLPIPKLEYVPADIKCGTVDSTPLLIGNTTGNTYYVTYMVTLYNNLTLPCNHYLKVTGLTYNSDLSIKFNTNDFKYMTMDNDPDAYHVNNFSVLIQVVEGNEQPRPDDWTIINLTPTLNGDGFINPVDLKGNRFIFNGDDLTGGTIFNNTWTGWTTNLIESNFGVTQQFGGTVDITRSENIHVMNYYLNLPNNEYVTTQNPTYVSGNKKITEIGLFDDNFDLVISGKFSTPINRVGSQVISVKLDI